MMTGRERTLLLYLFYYPEDVSETTAYTAIFAWAQNNLETSVKGAKGIGKRPTTSTMYVTKCSISGLPTW